MTDLSGKRVLIVEDEALLAMTVDDIVSDFGCVVVGPALSLDQAQTLAGHEPLDAAVLDVNVGGASSFGIADILRQKVGAVLFCHRIRLCKPSTAICRCARACKAVRRCCSSRSAPRTSFLGMIACRQR